VLLEDSRQGHLELDVKRSKNPALPVHDYRPALQCAVSWLGDRYVLAAPAQRRHPARDPFYAETRRWLPTTRQ
jgi:hypothetical protein